MNAHTHTDTSEGYREIIRRYTQGMALGRNDCVASGLSAGQTLEHVKMFTDGNLDKRFQKVRDQIEFFEDAFEDLEDLVVEYVRTVPLAAYDTGCTDTERFLEFIERKRELSLDQRDYIACQRTRHMVEFLGRDRRLQHVRFQELLASVEQFAPELDTNPRLWIHFNPVAVWTMFQTTALLDEDDNVPATVLFFPVGNDIRTAVLEDEGLALAEALEQCGRCRLESDALTAAVPDRSNRVELLIDLADIGVVAFG